MDLSVCVSVKVGIPPPSVWISVVCSVYTVEISRYVFVVVLSSYTKGFTYSLFPPSLLLSSLVILPVFLPPYLLSLSPSFPPSLLSLPVALPPSLLPRYPPPFLRAARGHHRGSRNHSSPPLPPLRLEPSSHLSLEERRPPDLP